MALPIELSSKSQFLGSLDFCLYPRKPSRWAKGRKHRWTHCMELSQSSRQARSNWILERENSPRPFRIGLLELLQSKALVTFCLWLSASEQGICDFVTPMHQQLNGKENIYLVVLSHLIWNIWLMFWTELFRYWVFWNFNRWMCAHLCRRFSNNALKIISFMQY